MGVKGLWEIIHNKNIGSVVELDEYRNKTLAVDLSIWVKACKEEAKSDNYDVVHYLQGIFERTMELLRQNATAVFILEGKEPFIPEHQQRDRNDRATVRMLQAMGLPCINAVGQAEQLCARLDSEMYVNGCITTDGDCFAYGARTIYKRFKGVDKKYTMAEIDSKGLSREKLVALAVLSGCDWTKGVYRVGAVDALKFFEIVNQEEDVQDRNILDRFRRWRYDNFRGMDQPNPTRCNICGHEGNPPYDMPNGCNNCNPHARNIEYYQFEKGLREKALKNQNFPDREEDNGSIIDEYLEPKYALPPRKDLKWKQPNVEHFAVHMRNATSLDESVIQAMATELLEQSNIRQLPKLGQTSHTG